MQAKSKDMKQQNTPSLKHHFLVGLGSVLDLGATNTTNIYDRLKSRTDHDAIASDWQAVGQAINHSLGVVINKKSSPQNDK